jgi:hypothetical protein
MDLRGKIYAHVEDERRKAAEGIESLAEQVAAKAHAMSLPVSRESRATEEQRCNGASEIVREHAVRSLGHDGYAELCRVYLAAVDQAAHGKGKERHATDEPFHEQQIVRIGQWLGGSPDFCLGQAVKKAFEVHRLPTKERRLAELLGAMNYLAAAYLLVESQ